MSTHTSFLEERLEDEQTSYGEADRTERSTDWGTDDDGVLPDVVVWPESTADVAAVVTAANEHGVPVTPYAAGTSLEGNAVPVERGITLDVSRMDAVLEVRPDDPQVDVQPGVLGDDLNDVVAAGETVSRRLVERALELGGTSTGEHGVGTGKREHLADEYDPAAIETMRSIKRALDPNGILILMDERN